MNAREESFTALDRHFADLMEQLAGKPSQELNLAARLVSHARGLGHICLPLRDLPPEVLPPEVEKLPALKTWLKSLRSSPAVGAPEAFKPLILDQHDRLYLRRYWEYEQRLAKNIQLRLTGPGPVFDAALLRSLLKKYFPATDEPDWQKLAAFTAITRNFSIISGGPGTGKTRTVVLILGLLVELAVGKKLRIALTAPTGKAAARLKESIENNRELCPQVRADLPSDATTIHRLLGTIPDSPYFRHTARNPLPLDVVVLDEASMVDLALMAKLADAVPPNARLILLGDKDQLTSVEAGAVLGDLCNSGSPLAPSASLARAYSRAIGKKLKVETQNSIAPIHDSIVELQKNYRFGSDSGIGQLSRAINGGDADGAMRLLSKAASKEIGATSLPAVSQLGATLREPIRSGFGKYLATADPASVLAAFDRFRILCAVRHGPYGVENLNRIAELTLFDAGVIEKTGEWYHGRPVIITRNDYNLRLFNGDVGIALADPESHGELRVFFRTTEGSLRRFLPARLPSHETVFAMTVHKSQGSEFEQVLLVLPDAPNPVVTRALLYTGLTRARCRVDLWYREAVLRAAILQPTRRSSGLRDALWKKQEQRMLDL